MNIELKSLQQNYNTKKTTIEDILYQYETCKKFTHLHSRAKHISSKKHIENLNRIGTQNMINKNCKS